MQCVSEGLPLIFDKGRNTKQGRSCNNGRSPHRTGSGLTYVSVLMIVDPGFVRWISEIRFHGRIHPSAAITAACVTRCKKPGSGLAHRHGCICVAEETHKADTSPAWTIH